MLKKRSVISSCVLILLAVVWCSKNTVEAIDPAGVGQRPELTRLLKYYDQHYDPSEQMLKVPFSGTGYHSQIANGPADG